MTDLTPDIERVLTEALAEQIAALVEQAVGDHLAAFLAQLPGDLFSETEIQRVREWAGEWSG